MGLLVALFLLWVLMVLVLVIQARMWDKIPGTGVASMVKESLFGPKCPTCNLRFTPDKCHWETSTACLDGKDYCAACKVKGMCGC